jgi:hypothetical protein
VTISTVYADLNMVAEEDSYGGGTADDGEKFSYLHFELPDISGGSVNSALLRLTTTEVRAGVEFAIRADNVGAWDEASIFSTLVALGFNADILTAQTAPVDDTEYDYEIKGDTSKGVIKAYADAETDITARLEWTNPNDGAITADDERIGVAVGNMGDGEPYVSFATRINATPSYRPQLVVDWSPAAAPSSLFANSNFLLGGGHGF